MTRDYRKTVRYLAAVFAMLMLVPLTGVGAASASTLWTIGVGVTADKTTYDTLNELITFEVTVTNTTRTTLPGDPSSLTLAYVRNTSSGVEFSNPAVGVCHTEANKKAVLLQGESFTCKATYRITQEDLDLGYINNQFVALGNGPGSVQQSQTASPELEADQKPAITLVKKATSGSPFKNAGDVITYELVSTNTGNVTLTNVQITDPKLGTLTGCTPALGSSLAPEAKMTCSGSYTVTQADVNADKVDNVATTKGTPPSGQDVTATDDVTVPGTPDPKIDLVKKATAGNPFAKVGDTITYSLEATNTGNQTLTNVQITDPKLGTLSGCAPALGSTLAPTEKMTCSGSYTVTQADVNADKVDNVATTKGTPPSGPDVTATDDVTVPGTPDPKIDLVKKATAGNPFAKVGDTITYSLEATNTGNQTLTNVQITDPKLGTLSGCAPALGSTLAPGEKMECTGTYTVKQADVNADKVDNVATTKGTPPSGPDVTATDDVTVPGTPDPKINLVKKATAGDPFANVGDTITYSLEATNTGNQTLTNVQITDPKLGTLSGCAPALGSTLAPGEKMECTGTYTVKQADVNDNKVDNTATATGKPPAGPDVTATDDVTVPGTPDPKINLVKKATAGDPFAQVGDTITYSLEATNTGNQTLTNVQITDPKLGTLSGCAPALGSTLAPTEKMTCTGTYTVTNADVDAGKVDNTATATGKPPAGPDVSAIDDVTVPGNSDPKIDLVKKATSGNPFTKVGDTITYSLVSTNTGNVNLTNVTITDPKLGQLSNCSPALGSTLARGASMTCEGSYTVKQDDVDAGKVDNTAATKGTPPRGPDVTATDSVTVPGPAGGPAIDLVKKANPTTYSQVGQVIDYTLVATNIGSLTLTDVVITDPKLTNLKCEPASPATLRPAATMTCTGQYTITQADIEAGQVRNTAKVTGTPPGGRPPVTDEDSAVVTGPVADLAITKTHTPATVTVGQNVSFTLTVRNLGPSTSYGVKVTDTLPSQLQFVSAAGTGWTCANVARVITCELGSPLAAGASSTIDVVAKTVAAGSAIVNVAVVESRTPDPNLANNRAEDVVGVTKNVIVCPADTVQKVGKLLVKGCRDVNVRALCRVLKPSAQGSLSYCRVKRVEKNGNVKVLAKSQYPVRVRVVWYAKATEEYKAFRKVRVYTLQPNR